MDGHIKKERKTMALRRAASSLRRNSKNRIKQQNHAYEKLEDRRMLAANIEIVDAYLIDGNFNRVTSPAHGEMVAVRAVWNTTDLPNDANYRIGFYVDGVERIGGQTTAGAGSALAEGYNWWHIGWHADGSSQDVEVIADVFDSVVEDDETDNTFNFSFTSQAPDIPQKMIWPMVDDPYSEVGVTNYSDIDPSTGIRDYAGRMSAYDGHNAFDTGPAQFHHMDAGYELFAAADGVVSYVHDGEFDRHSATDDTAIGNAVIIDHGNGWESIYWHLRRDSVKVQLGQSVTQRDVIGYMGSSGRSTGMHVHFGLQRYGRTVEPMMAEADYFVAPFGNVYDAKYVTDSGVSNYNFTGSNFSEGISHADVFSQASGQQTYVYAYFSGLEQDDLLEYVWHRPNGSVYYTGNYTLPAEYSNSAWFFGVNMPSTPDLGTWRVDLRVNGVTLGQDTFEIRTVGLPEARIEDSAGALINDNRFTPLDFGSPALNASDPTMTFTLTNHGTDVLTIGTIDLPANYYLVEGLPASLAVNASNTFTVAMDTAAAGFHAGEVRVQTNDADEGDYNFSVEGFVDNGLGKLVLGISERSMDEGETIVANVRRPESIAGDLTVNLSSSDDGEISMPDSVVIPDGENYVSFEIQILFDGGLDGDKLVEVYANATGFSSSTNTLVTLDKAATPEIIGRSMVYDNSSFDNYESGSGTSDDMAMSGKTALLPGEVATFENYSSYLNGINSIVLDTVSFAFVSGLSASDFVFRTGNGDNNSDFTDLATTPTVSVRAGEGANGSDRVTLSFPDGAITKTWLQVTVLANFRTGLGQNDVFYFGNAIGESGNDPATAVVNLADVSLTRSNQSGFGTVGLESDYDFDRNGIVNLADVAHARQNQSGFTPLRLITAPDGESQARSANPIQGKGGGQGFLAGSQTDGDQSVGVGPIDSIGIGEFMQAFARPAEEAHSHHPHDEVDSGFEGLAGFDAENGFGSDPYVAAESPGVRVFALAGYHLDDDTSRKQSASFDRGHQSNESHWQQIESDQLVLSGELDLVELIDFT